MQCYVRFKSKLVLIRPAPNTTWQDNVWRVNYDDNVHAKMKIWRAENITIGHLLYKSPLK